jgi:uncharacterized protein (UPF0264 family)
MQLLVSVRDAAEAADALAGGADIIDAKEPDAGPLGAVTLDVLRGIRATAAGVTVSAALGEASEEETVSRDAAAYASAGAAFVKIGFAGIRDAARAGRLLQAARSGAVRPAIIAVGYADADVVGSVAPLAVIDIAAWSGARGVLLDTAAKSGAGVRELMTARALAAWVRRAREAGLLAAVAGRLTAHDLPFIHDIGAHIAGVRGAACDGGRTGRISADKVRQLRGRIADADQSRAAGAAIALPRAAGDI